MSTRVPPPPLACGHDGRFEVTWKEVRSYAVVYVSMCIACNFDSVTKQITEDKKP